MGKVHRHMLVPEVLKFSVSHYSPDPPASFFAWPCRAQGDYKTLASMPTEFSRQDCQLKSGCVASNKLRLLLIAKEKDTCPARGYWFV